MANADTPLAPDLAALWQAMSGRSAAVAVRPVADQ